MYLENHPLNNYIYKIDDALIPLDTRWEKIAISVSGGADSALLSYLICDLIDKNNLKIEVHVISNVRMWKTRPWQRYNSIEVYEWLTNRFKNIKFVRHENYVPPELEYGNIGACIKDHDKMKSGDQIIVRSHAEYICRTNKINAWFGGITKNPPKTFSSLGMPDRNITDIKIEDIVVCADNLWVCHPFRNTSKDWIINQYKINDVSELLLLTRSCEGDRISSPEVFGDLDYKTYQPYQYVPECGKCFWCFERNWAKQINNI
jgi:hypothetical protein